MWIAGTRELCDEDSVTDDGYHHIDSIPPIRQLEEGTSFVDELDLVRLVITRPFIHRLLPFLQHNEQDDHMDDSAGTSGTGSDSDTPALKFNHVRFYCCCFCSEAGTTMDDDNDVSTPGDETMAYNEDDVCTPCDKLAFLSAIARLRGTVAFERSHDILSSILRFPEIDHLESGRLFLLQHSHLQESEFVRLGALIQRSMNTTKLSLHIYLGDAPQEFYDCLANSIHMRNISFGRMREFYPRQYSEQENMVMSKLTVGENGNGALARLLRNPQCQLTDLDLTETYFEDHHLIAMAQLLPDSKVESFSCEDNRISFQGLLGFFRQLPNMHSLRAFRFGYYARSESRADLKEECAAALLDGVMKNSSIMHVGALISYPPHPRLIHYQSLNRGGRKILASYQTQSAEQGQPGDSIPDALWPRVLARAGKLSLYLKIPRPLEHNVPANTVFFFLQQCPNIVSR